MLKISDQITLSADDIELIPIRAQGAGGQNVNKVSSAIHLRFDVHAARLPEDLKQRLLSLDDKRISSDGVIVIKAQRFRSQDKNRADALERLRELILKATVRRKPRKPTRPGRAARQRRMDDKSRRGETKAMRRKPSAE